MSNPDPSNTPSDQPTFVSAHLFGVQVPNGNTLKKGTRLECKIIDKTIEPDADEFLLAIGEGNSVSDFPVTVIRPHYIRENLNDGCAVDIGMYFDKIDSWPWDHHGKWDVTVYVDLYFSDGSKSVVNFGQIPWGDQHNYVWMHERMITGL